MFWLKIFFGLRFWWANQALFSVCILLVFLSLELVPLVRDLLTVGGLDGCEHVISTQIGNIKNYPRPISILDRFQICIEHTYIVAVQQHTLCFVHIKNFFFLSHFFSIQMWVLIYSLFSSSHRLASFVRFVFFCPSSSSLQ